METKTNIKVLTVNGSSKNTEKAARLDIKKTYKLYIDGKFPRTESGRYYALKDNAGVVIANVCRSSRKDVRDAVVSNRKAQEAWSKRSAYNKAQILYRIAETLEGRKAQFVATAELQGINKADALKDTEDAIDLFVYYAGWTDKFIQTFSSVNPVESSHFNFSYPEPTGVVMCIAPAESLAGMVAQIAPVIAGGNTCTVMVAENYPLTAIELAEVFHASDLPGGVVNILTGLRKELVPTAASHMDVNAIVYEDLDAEMMKSVQTLAAANIKRCVNFSRELTASPYRIMNCQEIKTTWHPVGI